jgi:hypothetical protein
MVLLDFSLITCSRRRFTLPFGVDSWCVGRHFWSCFWLELEQRLLALIDIRKWFAVCCWMMFHEWWEKVHGLSMMVCPHIPAHPVQWRTRCMVLTPTWFKCSWLLRKLTYCDSIQRWIEKSHHNNQGRFKHVWHAHCCVRSYRGYFVQLVWDCILWVCTGSGENGTASNISERKSEITWNGSFARLMFT